jgi:hypothetical protein
MPGPNGAKKRKSFEEWFPIVLRYAGVGLMIYAAVVDRGRNPALIPAATGMIFFKTIYGSGERN